MIYDLIIIGGGPAGYTGAIRAGEQGLKTLLIEKQALGGTCLNEGCVPTKTLLYSAKLKDGAAYGAPYGVAAEDVVIDHKKALARKDKVVKILCGGIKAQVKNAHADVLSATAEIQGKGADGFSVFADGIVYTAKNLLIATGSVPVIPSILGLKDALETGFAVTSKDMLAMKTVPKKLVVVGGGVIGLEIASYYQAAGSDVAVIEMLDTIGGPIDKDMARILKRNLEKKKIRMLLSCAVTQIKPDGVVYTAADGEDHIEQADTVLVSIGRRAAGDGLHLDKLGVAMDGGTIITDAHMQTNIPGVYAAGDVNGRTMLAHAAYREAEVAVCNMTGQNDVMRYNTVPGVIYTQPEVAYVGETENAAQAKGLDFIAKTLPLNFSGRYMAENERGDGIIKLIVDKETRALIGVHMIGSYASEIITSACILITLAVPIEDIKRMVFPHPTVSEIIREAVCQI